MNIRSNNNNNNNLVHYCHTYSFSHYLLNFTSSWKLTFSFIPIVLSPYLYWNDPSCLKGGVQLFHGVAATPQHSFVSYEASLCVARRVICFVSP